MQGDQPHPNTRAPSNRLINGALSNREKETTVYSTFRGKDISGASYFASIHRQFLLFLLQAKGTFVVSSSSQQQAMFRP